MSLNSNIRRVLFIILASLGLAACTQKEENTNGLWVWGAHMNEVDLDELAAKDFNTVFLHEKAFELHGTDSTVAFINLAHSKDLKVFVWVQCLFGEDGWTSPVDDEHNCYKQDFIDALVSRAVRYAECGADGIHLDYLHFGGTADEHNPSEEITSVGSITEICRQMKEALKQVNPRIVLAGSVMPEPGRLDLYGQDPMQMGKYLDVLIPMVYFQNKGYKRSPKWAAGVIEFFVRNGAPARIWAGMTTYQDVVNNPVSPLTADSVLEECKIIVQTTHCSGLVLFRYGLGELPDLNGIWEEKTHKK